jgi:HAD superfamily, subfamily IIIB (Acid phosphatase)
MRCFLFDIDGTIADLGHRLHHIQKEPKDWDSFFEEVHLDKPISAVISLVKHLQHCSEVVYVSGRSDKSRVPTVMWLREQGIGPRHPIYMRRHGDHRPDNIVKGELLDQILTDGYEPIMAFDDRNQVVKMWRERGIPCAQVAEGDF